MCLFQSKRPRSADAAILDQGDDVGVWEESLAASVLIKSLPLISISSS